MIPRKLLLTAALFLIATAAAQVPPSSVLDFESYLELQAAAAFTDGYVVDCPRVSNEVEYDYYALCVYTGDTGWSAAQLRDWSDYGLSGWTVFKAWQQHDGFWSTHLVHRTRNVMLQIAVTTDASTVTYIAGKM